MVHCGFSTGIRPIVRDMSRQLQRLNNWGLVCLNGNHGTAGETRGSNPSTRPLAVYGGAYLLHQRMVEGRDASAWCLRLVWSTWRHTFTTSFVLPSIPSAQRLDSCLRGACLAEFSAAVQPAASSRRTFDQAAQSEGASRCCMTCAREPATNSGCFQLG